jgi:hypothetical protein
MDETFRPRSNYIWAGISFFLITLFVVNSFVVIGNGLQNFFELILCMGLAMIVYLIWIRPKLVLRAEAIEVVNPIRSELIPYRDVLELETKWTLTIIHTRGKTKVWVAPASGKRTWIADKKFGWYGSGVPMTEFRDSGTEAMSESLSSASGQAAYLIRERIKRAH